MDSHIDIKHRYYMSRSLGCLELELSKCVLQGDIIALSPLLDPGLDVNE